MSTAVAGASMPAASRTSTLTAQPAYQAYVILHIGFAVLPILAGLDKFFHLLVDWDQYLSPLVTQYVPVTAHTFMLIVCQRALDNRPVVSA